MDRGKTKSIIWHPQGFCDRPGEDDLEDRPMPGTPIVSPGIVLIGLGLLIAILAVPLLLGWIPRNRFYGIRVPAAFASEENWYAINVFGAKRLLLFAAAISLLGCLCQGLPDPPFWLPIVCLVAVLPLLLLTVRSITRFAATFTRHGD
jgi:hypothetical protein